MASVWDEPADNVIDLHPRQTGTPVPAGARSLAVRPAEAAEVGDTVVWMLLNQGPLGILTPVLIGGCAYLGAHAMRNSRYAPVGAALGGVVGWEVALLLGRGAMPQ